MGINTISAEAFKKFLPDSPLMFSKTGLFFPKKMEIAEDKMEIAEAILVLAEAILELVKDKMELATAILELVMAKMELATAILELVTAKMEIATAIWVLAKDKMELAKDKIPFPVALIPIFPMLVVLSMMFLLFSMTNAMLSANRAAKVANDGMMTKKNLSNGKVITGISENVDLFPHAFHRRITANHVLYTPFLISTDIHPVMIGGIIIRFLTIMEFREVIQVTYRESMESIAMIARQPKRSGGNGGVEQDFTAIIFHKREGIIAVCLVMVHLAGENKQLSAPITIRNAEVLEFGITNGIAHQENTWFVLDKNHFFEDNN